MPSSKPAYLPHWQRDSCCSSVSRTPTALIRHILIHFKDEIFGATGVKKKMGRIRFQREGTKVSQRVQSPTEQLFLSE